MSLDFSRLVPFQGAMGYHRERHAVLAGNVANLDTPGYRPVDLERTAGTSARLAVTSTEHMQSAVSAGYTTTFDDGGALQGSDGNAV
ncbi:MAG TPA: flagellar basal body protein, partial [Kofleriaceae bacterium]|nr:flagellar basal body protein [Kofleriaceae bacterium]